MSANTQPDWERLLIAAARLQRILPGAVLVGGTASAIHARHRFSNDADHVLAEYRNLDSRWESWGTVNDMCAHLATMIFDGAA